MSVTVRHLNADSSFLLLFSPKENPTFDDLLSCNGAYSVLIDPWLVGSSIVNASWFAITHRVVPSSIQHLSEIEEPDVVLVSQNKPDHCHKQTLLQLRSEGKTLFAAEPRAAKAIKSWDHFDPNRIHALAKYDAKQRFGNTLRLRIPPLGPDGLAGELNIAFIPAKNYVTGLHNAFGITYRPPTRVKSLATVSTIELPKTMNMDVPFTPASLPLQSPSNILSPPVQRPPTSHARSASPEAFSRQGTALPNPLPQEEHSAQMSKSADSQPADFLFPVEDNAENGFEVKAIDSTTRRKDDAHENIPVINFDADALIDTVDFATTLPTPPLSPTTSSSTARSPRNSDFSDTTPLPPSASTNSSFFSSLPNSPSLIEIQSRYSRPPVIRPARPMALSILYSPHGIPLTDIQPYIRNHLVPLPGALPLTCLLHGFDFASNPWWFGGNIMMGMDGGIEIAKALMAKTWISAHDEEKDDQGLGVKLLKCDRNNVDNVKERIAQADESWHCDVLSLDVGTEVTLRNSVDRRKPNDLGVDVPTEVVGLGVGVAELRVNEYG